MALPGRVTELLELDKPLATITMNLGGSSYGELLERFHEKLKLRTLSLGLGCNLKHCFASFHAAICSIIL